MNLSKINVVILCGGLGLRLQSVESGPKALVSIQGKYFLDILLENLVKHGFRQFILCVGHQREKIKLQYKNNPMVRFSEELTPLGTGGALKQALPLIKSDPFLVMNGDSWCDIDFSSFFAFHQEQKAMLSMVLTKSENLQDYGAVSVLDDKVISFFEKPQKHTISAMMNAGIYLMNKKITMSLPKADVFSLEKTFFPQLLLESIKICGFSTNAQVLDIGTPERLAYAREVLC